MKVVILNTYDIQGGASKATFRLYQALKETNIKCKMIVLNKQSYDKNILTYNSDTNNMFYESFKKVPDKVLLDILNKNRKKVIFSTGLTGYNISKHKLVNEADIIHLNWINNNFVDIRSLRNLNRPIVWTLHDMWPFTGGCHYANNCQKYKCKCQKCNILNSSSILDLSSMIFNIKKKYYNSKMTIVTPSKWLYQCAKVSKLLGDNKISIIPNTLNIDIFKPLLNLDKTKFTVLFGADSIFEKRKGFKYLEEAINLISKKRLIESLNIIIFGASYSKSTTIGKFSCQYITKTNNEEKLAKIYNMADVFVIPSLEDNLPNTVLESLACAVPVVGFNVGGIPDMIEHKFNGYLARYKDAEDLAQGICWIYKNNKSNWLGVNARKKVEKNYGNDIIVDKYIKLYNSILNK